MLETGFSCTLKNIDQEWTLWIDQEGILFSDKDLQIFRKEVDVFSLLDDHWDQTFIVKFNTKLIGCSWGQVKCTEVGFESHYVQNTADSELAGLHLVNQ